MRIARLVVLLFIALSVTAVDAQRRGAGGDVTFAVFVTDPSGKPLGDVRVHVQGPATAKGQPPFSRDTRTERGRIAFENLPAGLYRLRFEHEGFITLERELNARGAAPIDVTVTLTPAPPPPPPAAPPPPPEPAAPVIKADPVIADIPGFLEQNFVGRGPSKTSPLACATGGSVTVMQLREPLEGPAREDVDEYLYVVGGEGTIRIVGTERLLKAGVFVMVPRGVAKALVPKGRNPLMVLSIKAGEKCAQSSGPAG